MRAVTTVALVILSVSAIGTLLRLVRPGSLADRMVALDLFVVIVVNGIAVYTVRTGSGVFLDVLLVTGLLGFLGTVTVARFIERRGAR
ncbi:MAG: monovalent cation/H+ antiporter complex subunit F [Acidimicrobiia bacterium]|nr:monovalent cation/H+ antiporter complex subunit F [Acidimicrobiia bacterium]